jgi:RNA polymerase sigma-70 factor (ECF subfamily)
VSEWSRHSDEVLLGATPRDPEAFGEFYRRHEDGILGFHLRRVGDPEVAIDLTAETFAAALRSARRFRPGAAPARAWLFGIARNTLAMSVRRRRVESRARRKLGLAPLAITDEALECVLALSETPVLDLVDTLPEQQRHALTERVVEERSYADIARDLQCSELVVRKRVSRALETLRDQVQGDDPMVGGAQ